jgi:hypothetical protein
MVMPWVRFAPWSFSCDAIPGTWNGWGALVSLLVADRGCSREDWWLEHLEFFNAAGAPPWIISLA